MRHVNGIQVRSTEGGRLSSRRQHELERCNGDGGNSPILKTDRVVQTARCARPSIRQRFDHGIDATQFFQQLLGRRFSVSGLDFPDNPSDGMTVEQEALEAVEEETASGLADIEQSEGLAGQGWQPGGRFCRQPAFVTWAYESYGHG